MKVNLLTIHWGRSYGAVLQTYATTKILEELGHEVYVINLQHPSCKCKSFKEYTLFLNNISFARFKKKYIPNLGKKTYSLQDITIPAADVTIVGSDQVWNHDITKNIGLLYFLPFCSGKKISLSSSFGKSEWIDTEEYTDRVSREFQKFEAISVREESGLSILRDVFKISDAVQTLDPTLIYGKFKGLLRETKSLSTIFPYLFNGNQESDEICQIVSDELGYSVYKYNHFTSRTKAGPLDWLEQIHNSPYIITNSFHGLAFSLLFKKEFIVLCADEKKFTRIKSLLQMLGLEDRYIGSSAEMRTKLSILHQKIDYGAVDEILAVERQKSMKFILESLNNCRI